MTEAAKPRAELPRVDRHALIIEDDPEQLAAYARGLLQHWRRIGKRGARVVRGYSKETIKAATVWLIGAYVDAKAPLPIEAAHLIRAIVNPKKGASTSPVRETSEAAYWAAIKFEAGFPEDPKGRSPSAATGYAVAKHLLKTRVLIVQAPNQKTAQRTVEEWRKLPHYQANVQLYRAPVE
jgi:hypothetical protein